MFCKRAPVKFRCFLLVIQSRLLLRRKLPCIRRRIGQLDAVHCLLKGMWSLHRGYQRILLPLPVRRVPGKTKGRTFHFPKTTGETRFPFPLSSPISSSATEMPSALAYKRLKEIQNTIDYMKYKFKHSA